MNNKIEELFEIDSNFQIKITQNKKKSTKYWTENRTISNEKYDELQNSYTIFCNMPGIEKENIKVSIEKSEISKLIKIKSSQYVDNPFMNYYGLQQGNVIFLKDNYKIEEIRYKAGLLEIDIVKTDNLVYEKEVEF